MFLEKMDIMSEYLVSFFFFFSFKRNFLKALRILLGLLKQL